MKINTLRKLNKKGQKKERVLKGVIELYIEAGKPIGSQFLMENGFDDMSSATIRNYFAKLEKERLLTQSHTSSGRVPTNKGFSWYAEKILNDKKQELDEDVAKIITPLREKETKAIASFLQDSAELLSQTTKCAVFLSAPRFDHDFILNVKLVPIDANRYLCVLITDFGLIHTEVFCKEEKISHFTLKRIEKYFSWRLTGKNKPENLTLKEEARAKRLYNETIIRYIVGYSNFSQEDVYRTGFSKLIEYSDFKDIVTLTNGLSLFENSSNMRKILNECMKSNKIEFWIGDELKKYSPALNKCGVIAIPYYVNQSPIGAVGILGPTRMPYKELFATLDLFSKCISTALTNSIYKFKISYRTPQKGQFYLGKEDESIVDQQGVVLLEHKE